MNYILTKHENGALSQNRLSQSQLFKPPFSLMGLLNSAFAAKNRFLALALGIIFLILGNTAYAQEAQNASYPNQAYTFSAQSGTFSYLTGGTAVTAIQADDTYSTALPIGFTFRFGCEDYTRVIAGSNGTLEFSASGVFGATNAALTGTQVGLAPLWDDLNGAVGAATYATTGTAPNRVFTMEWKNWKWYYNTTAASISFQVRLYEGSNTIEYQYKQEAGALNTPSASIGFYNGSLGIAASAKQMWLQDVTATPATSATISTTIATKPIDGQIYRFVNNNNCLGICTGQTVLNGTGGATTTDGLQIQVSGAGNIQIYKQGVQQVYNAQITAGTTNPFGVPGTTHGVAMNIGTSVFKSGSLGSGAAAANFTILYNTCQNAIGAVGGTQRDTLILRAVKNSLNYDLKLIYTYTYPNTFMNIQYLVTIPAGNTEVVKVTQGWDTFLAGGDAGPGFIQGTTPNLTMGVAKLPSYEAFQYVSGVPWSSYYSAVYSSINSSMAAANNFSLTNVIDPTATTDNGMAIQIDYGSTAGSFQSSNNVIFSCNAGTTAPTVSSTTKTNVCPSNTVDLTTLVTSTPPVGTVIYWTDATGAALATPNSVSTSGTYYVAYRDLSSGCTSPATAINYSVISCTDTDGDGIVDAIDIDDDNDGVLDVTECSDNRVSNGVFPTTGGNTNTVTGWTVGGTYAASGSWVSPTGRVNLGTGGLTFQRDFSTVSNIFQPLTNVTSGSRIVISNIIWLNTVTNLSDGTAILEIKYAGTTYATINTGVGLPSTPSITASNGAIVSVGILPTLSTTGAWSTATNLTISLPSSIPVTGNLELNFIAASHATQVDDIAVTAIAMYGCKDTDSDGTPNYLGLDSDADGCSDAYEAGATTDKTANFKFTSAVGSNGLANSLETVADNGVVNYTSTYTAYALNGALNKCNLSSPGCVTGLKTWLKADGVAVADGAAVATWLDLSGLGYDLTQATAASQPKFYNKTAAKLINFNPTLDFDGVDDHLRNTTTLMPSASPYTFLSVGIDEDAATGYRSLFSSENAVDYFALYKQGGATADNGWVPYAIGGQAKSAPFIGDRGNMGKGTKYSIAGGANGFWNGTNFTSDGRTQYAQPQIVGFSSLNNAPTDPFYTWTDGYKEDPNWSPIVDGIIYRDNHFFTQLSIGADVNVEVWKGRIPEFMVWDKVLSDAEMARVNTYLAIKYSITLGQGNGQVGVNSGNYNYVSGAGSVIWDATANNTYKGNIAGIGRENCQGLNQKQSTSIQAGFQPIIGLTRIDSTNVANPSVLTDATYEIWGNDAGAASYATAVTAPSGNNANFRMTRVWKIQETGAVGTVKVAVPFSSNQGYLVVSADATFDGTDTWIPLSKYTVGSTDYSAGDIDFTNGQYFTFATFLAGPGGVVDVDFWIKSDDAGTIGTAWKDHSKNGNPIEAVGTWSLSAADAAHNFYPYTTGFSTTKYFRDVNTSLTADNTYGTNTRTPFAVFSAVKPNGATGRIVGIDNDDLFAAEPGFSILNNKPYFYKYWETTISYTHTTAINNGENSVLSYNATQTAANAGTMQIGKDGAYQNFNLTGYWHNLGKYLEVGYGTWDINAPFPGDIMEVAWYKRNLTANEQDRVNSYLGIKNGVTLSIDYLASNGSVIWNRTASTGFNNNIFGIGRDDASVLYQKQAKSANATAKMTIGLADSISTSNATHPSVFSNDALFIVIGDNGLAGVVTPSVSGACPPPPSADKASAQKFKVVETGAVQSIKVLFNPSGLGFNNAFAVYMQVASDSSFTSLIANVPMQWSGANVQTNYNFASNTTSYVRFMGNTTSLANLCTANGSKTFYFNGWNYGTKTKDIVANYAATATAGDLVMKTTVTDGTPNVLLYRPNVDWYPVYDGYGLFFPRWGSSANENSTITTKIAFLSQATTGVANASTTKLAAATASFMIWDLDGYIGSRDIVKVYGKLGSAVIDAKLTRNQYTALSLNYGGDPQSVIGGTAPWDLSYYGRLYVNFETPVEEIYIEYKQDATYAFNSYQDFRVGPITATCKAPTPKVVTPNNVYIYKEVASPVKSGDVATYKFTIQNLNCGDKTINFSDILPSGSGLIWADSSLSTPLSIGTTNAYGNSQTLTLTNITVPAGMSYLFIDAKTTTVGTFNNQATFTVGGNSYTTDDPTASGAGNQPTALNVIANDPDANLTVAKTVNKTTAGQNDVLTYTYVITNPNGTAINATFDDQIPADAAGNTVSFVASSLTGAGAALVSPYAATASLTIRNLSIPANGSTTLTIQANTGSFVLGDTIKNVASVVPDVSAGYRLTNRNSGSANTNIQAACVAGSAAPSVSATTLSNSCPTTTVNLNSLHNGTIPSGARLRWHTVSTNPTAADSVATPSVLATAGTYYAYYFDATNNCNSPATVAVAVTITSPCAATFTFNCGSATSTGTFTANATAGQTGTLVIPMTGATAGSATFTVTATGFTGNLSTSLTAGQASVTIPITYDGTGAAGTRTLTITSTEGVGTCTKNITVSAASNPCLLGLPFLPNLGGIVSMPNFCIRGNYNYYKASSISTQEILAINQNGNVFNPVTIALDATTTGTHTLTSGGRTTALAHRMVTIEAPGTYTINGGLKVRIFYNPLEFLTLPTATRRWFKHTAHTKAGVLADLTAVGLANATYLTPDSTGTENGLSFVEFRNITSFSTFGFAASTVASFAFDCGTATSTGTFISNGTAGQTGTLVIPMTGATAGSATFNVTGTGFTGSLSTTLTGGQASVTIPITYDGIGAVGSRTLTVTSSEGTGACTPSVSVVGVPDLTTTIGQPSPVLTVGQSSNLPITVANIGNGAAPGIITTTITLPSGVTAPPTFTSNGWTCSTTAPSVTCTNAGPIAAGGSSTFNVPVTPDITTVGTKPIFTGTTNPVTGETNTSNNAAAPLTPSVNVLPANCNWTPGTIGK